MAVENVTKVSKIIKFHIKHKELNVDSIIKESFIDRKAVVKQNKLTFDFDVK